MSEELTATQLQLKHLLASVSTALEFRLSTSSISRLLTLLAAGSSGVSARLVFLRYELLNFSGSLPAPLPLYFLPLPPRYWSMELAAFLPAAMAATTVAGPVIKSPPAKTFLPRECVEASTFSRSFLSRNSPGIAEVSGSSPIAFITASKSVVNSEPATGTGLGLPDLSRDPSFILVHLRAILPPFFDAATGWVRNWILMPSSSAFSTSSFTAGISALLRR
ncbi:hypothetical protein ES708_16471 [subsurface metagenome]